MITKENINEKVIEYHDKNGKWPKYILIDRLSNDYLKRIPESKNLSDVSYKFAMYTSNNEAITILTVDLDKEFLEVVS